MIQTLDVEKFKNYLKQYKNTICGRNPICLLLNVFLFFIEIIDGRNIERKIKF
jgi:predicted class III extradiol MEMO1 family dioxygenase